MAVYSVRKSLIPLAKKVVLTLNKEAEPDDKRLKAIRNELTKKNGGILPTNLELVRAYQELTDAGKLAPNPPLLKLIRKRKVRTLSGIANITVLTKALGCPGQCIYCPTEKGMPKSYLSNEPAMMRAVLNDFSAYKQIKTRLNGLVAQGHDVTKIDVRTAGGTWGAVPLWYQEQFIKEIYLALNEGPGKIMEHDEQEIKKRKLEEIIKKNETAECRCVGLWVETRPDWVNKNEIKRLRSYGVTGIELGVQTTDDKVNEFCKRGHGIAEVVHATQLCRDAGLKICYHIMPNLPTATLESDLKTGNDLFEREDLRPDHLKIYPTVVTPFTELERMLSVDPTIHIPYTEEQLTGLIADIKKQVPEYCRITRIIRDIPAESIVQGSKKSNLRQEMQRTGVICRCIRCREIQDASIGSWELIAQSYRANGGTEHFITIEEPTLDKIIGLCRLRLPSNTAHPIFPDLQNTAIIREVHVYGEQQSLSASRTISKTQHQGFGKMLMQKAEDIAKEAGVKKLAVIAAIGTREYYKKLGYQLEGTYMVKTF